MTKQPIGSNSISSSNRSGGACDAVLQHQDRSTGPVRLPTVRSNDFIDQFNRLYGKVGLKMTINQVIKVDAEVDASP
ncbi:hypothetical protein [Rubripirellula reticaptiva]|uniref:Uncharacterized protein n=1 Tax=Rubripirellula reticaptiva TaxID=2528013 RepID=A0A5C6ES15_9BACT|nr:hypothetical protein [Rubripirellula reticaptiva]TWU51120.1 hypothetical protein Poly59_27090 [Rubripirellula reticaptiva]